MKKYAAMLAAALIALLGLTALAPSAEAYPTQPVISITLNLDSVLSHHHFVAHVKVSANCDTLTVSFLGQSGSAAGSSLTHTFIAPLVTIATVEQVKATCVYTAVTGRRGAAISPSNASVSAFKDITILPLKSSGNGVLPNTGGPSIGWLIGGLLALLAGIIAMIEGRRRSAGTASH